ncbi:type II toxin-antitoxin system RelB/DinJ family antitoxin, partial [Bifidobacterium breve]
MMAIKEKATISLDAQTKRDGIAILDAMGLNLSTFAEMSLRQLVRDGRLPFT